MPEQLTFDSELERARREAWDRAELGMARSASRAERVRPGWHDEALEAVRVFATDHRTFLAEQVRKVCPIPSGADGRAFGAVIQEAKRKGWIAKEGAAPATSSNLSLKVLWRSLICAKETA